MKPPPRRSPAGAEPSGELFGENPSGSTQAGEGQRARSRAIDDEHHIVAVGKGLRQRDQMGALDHESVDPPGFGRGGEGVEPSQKNAVVRALDLEVERVAVSGDEVEERTIETSVRKKSREKEPVLR